MADEGKKHRTMWMFPRNIRQILPWKLHQILQIMLAFEGDAGSQETQDAMYEQLASLGVKIPRSKTGIDKAGGMRTYFAQLKCLGFLWKREETGRWETTIAGDALLSSPEPAKVLRCQLMRMQYPSSYGSGPNVAVSPDMKVKPLRFLVRLLRDERLGGRLTCTDMAVAVIYGRREEDFERVVQKILEEREGGGLEAVIDSADDVRTPRRCSASPEEDLLLGAADAISIANTAKNYLSAAQIIVPCEGDGTTREDQCMLTADARILKELEPWLSEPIEPLTDRQEAWQRRFGRFDRRKDTRTTSGAPRLNGITALLQSRIITAAGESPYDFDVKAFCKAEAVKWSMAEADVARAVRPVLPRIRSVERDAVMRAAASGGVESLTLEKSVTAIFRRLGFELSEHIGQKKAPGRRGGYPDVRIRAARIPACGMGDAKATSRYDFPLGDESKLGSYYKECWSEFPDRTPEDFFLYIAGGFMGSAQRIEAKLDECTRTHGRPVSAITVEALLDMAEMEAPPAPDEIMEAFRKGRFYASASL